MREEMQEGRFDECGHYQFKNKGEEQYFLTKYLIKLINFLLIS